MKIMFYINSIQHGGAERVMSNLATMLSQKGIECILVTSFQGENEYSVGDKVKRISLFKEKLGYNFWMRNIVLVKSLRKYLKMEKPNILISFMAEPNFRTILSSIGLKNKTLISIRNDPNKEYCTTFTRILASILYRFADGIVFQTEDAKKWFPKAIQKKSRIIFNQVDEVFYNTVYDSDRHDIVTTGRLVPQKNHKMLIKAFASIAGQVADNLIIYGEGELRAELEYFISELHMEGRIFLPGITKNVPNTIKSAKMFVLTSDYEGMPNSLMEAMALGLPCISTNCPCGGPKMLLDDGKNGVLVSVGDTETLSKIMLLLLNDTDKLKKMSENAKNSAKMFSPEKVINEWKTYIDELIS